ncbi:aldehyde dehydrogenase family protein [Mesorhizobium sp. Cs1299R1N3]|uniref:aldehyde dehydrogenase family protein n=1 Tax=Mesorhizobium sp. Cs1299R1N3 TaxID=3015173 RepID=UPI00301DB1E3
MGALQNDLTKLSSATRAFLDREGGLFIGNSYRPAAGRGTIPVIDPSSGSQISTLAAGGEEDVAFAVAAAKEALHGSWQATPAGERERLLWRWADILEANADYLAELDSVDVGMPLWMARHLNVQGAIGVVRYMAGWATKISGRTVDVNVPIPGSEYIGYTLREPVGIIGAIIPWNVPAMLAAWKISPALAAGCTVVIKPSEVASLSVLVMADLAREAGIPAGVINVLTGTGAGVGDALVSHPDVSKITFTGSTATGVHIAKRAAEGVKKVTLELGGKSPQLLFADADLDKAVPGIAGSIFLHSGQICVAGSRLYVQRTIFDETVTRLKEWADGLVIGPGLDAQTQVGPLASEAQQKKVEGYIESAKAEGGETVTESSPLDASGYYVRPTVVANAKQSMKAAREEIFGPVLTVIAFDEFDEVINYANDTDYGLSASVWTRDLATAHRAAARIKSGKVVVNSEPLPYPSLPEGGRKASGYGRDLGPESLEGYLETKSVIIRTV